MREHRGVTNATWALQMVSRQAAILFLLALKGVKLVPIQCVQVSVLLWQGVDLACKTTFPNRSFRVTQSLLFVPLGILPLFSYKNKVL